MGKSYLIDTNSVIDYLNNKLPDKANQLIDNHQSKISVITRMELLGWAGANDQQTEILEEYVNTSLVFPLDEPVIIKTIQIRKATKAKLPDAIIAATALVNQLVLITRNTKDFTGIDGLKMLDPYTAPELQAL